MKLDKWYLVATVSQYTTMLNVDVKCVQINALSVFPAIDDHGMEIKFYFMHVSSSYPRVHSLQFQPVSVTPMTWHEVSLNSSPAPLHGARSLCPLPCVFSRENICI
jgi:hypothetical protein